MKDGTPPKTAWFRDLVADLAVPPSGPRFRPFFEGVLPLLIAGVLTVLVRVTGFDLEAARWIHRVGGGSWALGDHPFWKALYYGGTVPAALAVFAALGLYLWSWRRPSLAPWRKVSWFVTLSGLIGPGVITNAVIKELWGRPRPRELSEFGGRSGFEPVFSYDASSEGLSFPCGHATMGFFFLAGYFLFRRHRRGLADGFLFGSLVAGGLMGIARMAQGAHFFSDVVWAAVVCWYTPMGLYYGLGLDRGLVLEATTGRRMPWWLRLSAGILGLAMLAGVLLATPYQEQRHYEAIGGFAKTGPLRVRLVLSTGRVEIVPGETFRISAEADGHGFPTSKIGRNFMEMKQEDGAYLVYAERMSGWLTEVNARLRVEVPWTRMRRLELETGEAEVALVLAPSEARPLLKLTSGTGPVVLEPSGQGLRLERAVERIDPGLLPGGAPGATVYRLEVGSGFVGDLRVGTGERP
jgi:membrane-associated PAP2 superfamily phosphatase